MGFTGAYVLHDHILPRKDHGVMQLVRLVKADKYTGLCQASILQHH